MEIPNELQSLRTEIDRLDRELVELLARRRDVVKRVADVKRRWALPVTDPAREQSMRRQLLEHAADRGVPAALITNVLDAVLLDSRALVARTG